MYKLGLLALLMTVIAAESAFAGPLGIFGRRAARPNVTVTPSHGRIIDYDDSDLPYNGQTRVQDGWNWVFRRRDNYSGTWYATHPTGTSAGDYSGGYPVDGSRKYEDGLWWTYSRSRNTWVSEWYRVR